MAGKFYGKVGFVEENVQTSPGVWEDKIVIRELYGEFVRQNLQERIADQILPDLTTASTISLMADAYSRDHFHAIRWVEWEGVKWVVTQVEPIRPRLIVRLGGKYNGQTS